MTEAQNNNPLQQAVLALHNGIPGQARAILAPLIEQGVDNPTVWAILALACRDQGDMKNAVEAANRSLQLEPRNPRALSVKGDACFKDGDQRGAAAFYRNALSHIPAGTNLAPDMAADMQRAKERMEALAEDFCRHLSDRVGSLIEKAEGDTTRMTQAVDLLMGRRQVYYPRPQQIFFPGLPVLEFAEPADFDWIPSVEAAFEDILAEAQILQREGAEFEAYLKGDDSRPAYDVHGLKDNKDWGAFYLWYNGEPVPENQQRCPATTAAMEAVPLVFSGRRCPNVLFSRLRAGAKIPPHNGMINSRLICHLALIIPDGCGFRVGNDVREWEPGKVWLFDDTVEHEAWNNSDEDRFVLIFEVWKPELSEDEKKLVTRMLEAVDSY